MKIPEMVKFNPDDILAMDLDHRANKDIKDVDFGDIAFTFKIDGKPMASAGVIEAPYCLMAWMYFSKEARTYPRVAWAIREMLDSVCRRAKEPIYAAARADWPEAIHFIEWLDFRPTGEVSTIDSVVYFIYCKELLEV